jgi:predicted Abi (CAAX) family protease
MVTLSLLGLACSAPVPLTGRMWPAVLVHVVYKTSFVAPAFVGSILS